MIVDVEDSVKTCRSCTAAKGRLDVIRVNVDQSDAANLTWKESRRSTSSALAICKTICICVCGVEERTVGTVG